MASFSDSESAATSATDVLQNLPVDRIYASPHQMRRHFDEASLRELARSMKQEGLIQPITVRPVGNAFELVAGERRLKAAQMLGWETILARIIEVSDEDAAIKGLIENLQRADLNCIEEARGFRQLTEAPYKLTQEAIAQRVGKSQAAVARCLALLELPEEIQQLVQRGALTESHTRCLRKVTDRTQMIEMANQAGGEHWSVKEIEKQVRDWLRRAGLPDDRRQSERRKDPVLGESDPLAEVWPQLLYTPDGGTPGTWNVRYEGSGQWIFEVWAESSDPKSSLGEFFIRLGKTLRD